jgi:hypothetical protein
MGKEKDPCLDVSRSPAQAQATTRIIAALALLNVLSLAIYAADYHRTGRVINTSGGAAEGYHEIPAILSFLAFGHQILRPKMGNRLHKILGYVAMASAVVCVANILPKVDRGIRQEFNWTNALPLADGSPLRFPVLVLNETVNIYQFLFYGALLLHQLYRGYGAAKDRHFAAHRDHMQAATLLLLGPLAQRFAFNHLTDRRAELGVGFQVVTIAILTLLQAQSVARNSLRNAMGLAFGLAIGFVTCDTSALSYLLRAVE